MPVADTSAVPVLAAPPPALEVLARAGAIVPLVLLILWEVLSRAGVGQQALQLVHRPTSYGDVTRAQKRLKWDEAFVLQVVLAHGGRGLLGGREPLLKVRLRALEGKPLKPAGVAIGPGGQEKASKWSIAEARKYNKDADGIDANAPVNGEAEPEVQQPGRQQRRGGPRAQEGREGRQGGEEG